MGAARVGHRAQRRATGLLAGIVALGGVVVAAGLVAPAGAEGLTLAEAGDRTGRTIGVAVMGGARLGVDPVYTGIVEREFASVTPENELKFDVVQPSRNSFNYAPADKIVSWALARGKRVHGYSPLYGAAQSAWLAALSSTLQREAMVKHLSTVIGYYKGKVASWDVVSEAFMDGTGARRPGIFERTGGDWIEVAFRTARAADPSVRLCYSDYGIEDWGAAKTQAVHALLKDFRARGVPVDCVSLQSHFTGVTKPSTFRTTMLAFTALGLDVELSELDVTGNAQQPAVYASVAVDCLTVPRCTGITVWGVRDSDSWRAGDSPVLFDRSGAPKPAYTAFRNALWDDGGCAHLGGSARAVSPLCTAPPTTMTGPSTSSPTPSSPRPSVTTSRTKRTTTVCRTRKKGAVTCKVVTRR